MDIYHQHRKLVLGLFFQNALNGRKMNVIFSIELNFDDMQKILVQSSV